jgi:hypothetical protein
MRLKEDLEVEGNLEIIGYDRGKRRVLYQRTHNIIVNNGRSFLVENIAASAFAGSSFTRHQNTVVRYIGFGIGGDRQVEADASASPLADTYPAGYGGTNTQDDATVAVARLERPVLATATNWMKEVATPATFLSATEVQWTATFAQADLNLAPYTSMPISEIGMYKSSADPTLPNGGAGTYPGPTGHMLAYDTFDSFPKHSAFSIVVNWAWRF